LQEKKGIPGHGLFREDSTGTKRGLRVRTAGESAFLGESHRTLLVGPKMDIRQRGE